MYWFSLEHTHIAHTIQSSLFNGINSLCNAIESEVNWRIFLFFYCRSPKYRLSYAFHSMLTSIEGIAANLRWQMTQPLAQLTLRSKYDSTDIPILCCTCLQPKCMRALTSFSEFIHFDAIAVRNISLTFGAPLLRNSDWKRNYCSFCPNDLQFTVWVPSFGNVNVSSPDCYGSSLKAIFTSFAQQERNIPNKNRHFHFK